MGSLGGLGILAPFLGGRRPPEQETLARFDRTHHEEHHEAA